MLQKLRITMDSKSIVENIRFINQLLVVEDYAMLIKLDRDKKFDEYRIQEIIKNESRGKVTELPENLLMLVDIYGIDNPNEVLVQFDLWINQEKSDLTITCKLYNDDESHFFSIENLRVL